MTIKAQLQAIGKPGYANLTIRKWPVDEAATRLEIAVQRNQDSWFYQGQGNWLSEQIWHPLDINHLDQASASLSCTIGPELVDPILEAIGNSFRLYVRSAQKNDQGSLIIDEDVYPSSAWGAGGTTLTGDLPMLEPQLAQVTAPEEMAEIESPATAQIQEPTPVPPSASPATVSLADKKKSAGWWKYLLLIFCLLAGVAIWYLMFKNQGVVDDSSPAGTDSAGSNSNGCNIAASTSEYDFVQDCLASKPDNARLLEIFTNAEKPQCGAITRLITSVSRGGNAEIALAMAKALDPGQASKNICFNKDAETAFYWYEQILEKTPDAKEVKELRDKLSQDPNLPEILKN